MGSAHTQLVRKKIKKFLFKNTRPYRRARLKGKQLCFLRKLDSIFLSLSPLVYKVIRGVSETMTAETNILTKLIGLIVSTYIFQLCFQFENLTSLLTFLLLGHPALR